MPKFNETILQAMVELEGLPFEEAKLTYAQRENLPETAFCGPNRTYPAHDAAHIRNALTRLGTFGRRLKPAVRSSIIACLKTRAKKYGIEINETAAMRNCLAKFDETIPEATRKLWLAESQEIINYYNPKKK